MKFYLEFDDKQDAEDAALALRQKGISVPWRVVSQQDLHEACEANLEALNESMAERDVIIAGFQSTTHAQEEEINRLREGMANLGDQLETAVDFRERAVKEVEELRLRAAKYGEMAELRLREVMDQRDAVLRDSERSHSVQNGLVAGIKALTALVDPA